MDYGRLFEWGIVVTFLGLILYAAFIIKGERNTYIQEALPLPFHHFQFFIPKWWTLTSDESFLRFERTDTRYDWFAQFSWHPLIDENKNANELLVSEIEKSNNGELPKTIGLSILMLSILGVVLFPISGFWLIIPPAIAMLLNNGSNLEA